MARSTRASVNNCQKLGYSIEPKATYSNDFPQEIKKKKKNKQYYGPNHLETYLSQKGSVLGLYGKRFRGLSFPYSVVVDLLVLQV